MSTRPHVSAKKFGLILLGNHQKPVLIRVNQVTGGYFPAKDLDIAIPPDRAGVSVPYA